MQSPFLLTGTPCSGWALHHGSDPAASCYHGNSSCCSGIALRPTPGGRGRMLWQSLDLLWRKSLHPKELEDGVCHFRAAQGEALQSSTLPFCHLHSRFVWEVLLCSECKQRTALQGWSCAVFGCCSRMWCPRTCSAGGYGAVYSPSWATWSLCGGCKKRKKIQGKCQANAFLACRKLWPGYCSWLNWPSGCACLLWPTSTNCCGTLEVPRAQ